MSLIIYFQLLILNLSKVRQRVKLMKKPCLTNFKLIRYDDALKTLSDNAGPVTIERAVAKVRAASFVPPPTSFGGGGDEFGGSLK